MLNITLSHAMYPMYVTRYYVCDVEQFLRMFRIISSRADAREIMDAIHVHQPLRHQ